MRLFLLALLCVAAGALAQDYERERRWAAEVAPNLVVGDAVQIPLGVARDFLGIHTEARTPRTAILLIHGIGVHPDHGVIGILRAALPDLGYTTLSIQMPVQKSGATADDYSPAVFAEAAARIRAAAAWLARKGYGRPVLLSHSLGSRMANAYFEQTADAPFAAWISLGLPGGFGPLGNVKTPVLDVAGEKDMPQVLEAGARRSSALQAIPGSARVVVAGANHHYNGREKELAAAIHDFLRKLK